MSVSVTVAGTSYAIPTVGEVSWGPAVTSWIQAISSATLQTSGGLFTLTADLNFGASFGLISQYYKSGSSLNIAGAGIVRLANADLIEWRNAANSADLGLTLNSSNIFTLAAPLTVTGNLISTNIASGATLAGTNSGDVTLAAFGSTPNANGLSLSTQALNMQPADGTHPGGVSIAAQTFAGIKTFSSATLHADGSSSTPGVSFANETNSGIYRIGTGDIGFQVDGILGMELIKSGSNVNVGIGTAANASAGAFLTLQGSINGQGYTSITNTSSGTSSSTSLIVGNGPGANVTTVENWANNTINTYLGGGSAIFGGTNQTQFIIGSEYANGFIGFTVGGRTLATEAMRLVQSGSTGLTLNKGWGTLNLSGSSSGVVSISTQAAAGTYNFNLPTTAGGAGYVLTSQGGSASAMTWTGVAEAPTANTIAAWDNSANLSANNLIDGYATTVTSSGTISLTVASASQQYFTGSTASQVVKMPAVAGLVTGMAWTIVNQSSVVVTVQSSGGNTIQAMAANTQLALTCISTAGTGIGSWQWTYTPLAAGLPLTNPMTTSGDVIYGGSSGVPTRLAANATATNKYLQSVSSGVPSWVQVAVADLLATVSVGTSGYIVLPGGLYVQYLAGAASSTGGVNTNWPISFPTSFFGAVAIPTASAIAIAVTGTTAHATITSASSTPSCFVIGIGN